MIERRSKKSWLVVLGVFALVFGITFLVQKINDRSAEAANMGAFEAGYIISDYQMTDYNSMSESQIQSFLKSKNSCNDRDLGKYTVGDKVNYFSESTPYTWHIRDGHFVCMADESFNGESAAHIIWQAAQDFRINPKVLIVILQKEQGLVTDTFPNSIQYRSAMGYGCPDTAPCSPEYAGFKNQIRNAAGMIREVMDGGWSTYPVGNNYVQYNPSASCGGSTVNIRNRATSALYRYTPYQPNRAVLNGGGDGCSAYGNSNFYRYFEDWFGGIKDTQNSIRLPEGTYYLRPTSDSSLAMDVLGGSDKDGANVQLYSFNQTTAQQWKITYNSVTDDYNIINVASGKALDVDGAGDDDGTNIQSWEANQTCAQRWKMIRTSKDNVKILSSCSQKALDVDGASFKKGTNIQLWRDNETSAQNWSIMPVDTLYDEGIFVIESKINESKVVDISGGIRNAGDDSNIQVWVDNNTGAQRWVIKKDANGYFSVVNAQSGRALDVEGGSAKDGANIHLWRTNNTCAQKWKILKNSDYSYTFISACSNSVLDLTGAKASDGSNIQLYGGNNTKAQKWTLKKIDVVEDGEYEIASAVSNNKVIDITANRNADGTNIQLYEANNTNAQRWKITYDENTDYYTIVNPASKRSLDAEAAGTVSGTNIHLWQTNKTCAQKWTIYKDADGKYEIASGCSNLLLDVKDIKDENGANIQLWRSNGTIAQKWILRELK